MQVTDSESKLQVQITKMVTQWHEKIKFMSHNLLHKLLHIETIKRLS